MGIFDVLAAVLTVVEQGNIVHRARAIERDESDDVLEAVGLHIDESTPHAGAFHLEHAERVTLA